MTTQEIAKKVADLCREGKWEEIYQNHYSPDIVSIEPEGAPWGVAKGMEEIAEKAQKWQDMVEAFHSSEVSDPLVADNFFTLTMKTKVTMKGMKEPIDMDEVCVYKVVDGKVVSEQFFYTPVPQFAN